MNQTKSCHRSLNLLIIRSAGHINLAHIFCTIFIAFNDHRSVQSTFLSIKLIYLNPPCVVENLEGTTIIIYWAKNHNDPLIDRQHHEMSARMTYDGEKSAFFVFGISLKVSGTFGSLQVPMQTGQNDYKRVFTD